MLITPHAIAGSVIGDMLDNPGLVVILAFLSHFLLDMLPHYDIGVKHNFAKKIKFDIWDWVLIIADGLIGLIIVICLYIKTNNVLVLYGAFFAIIPDIIDDMFRVGFIGGKLVFDFEKKIPIVSQIHKFHEKIHFKLKPKYWYWGIISQIIIIIGGILIVL